MRFKPPPPNSDIGWRVEFRPMEVCVTGMAQMYLLPAAHHMLVPLSEAQVVWKAAHIKWVLVTCKPNSSGALLSENTWWAGGLQTRKGA